MSQKSGSSSTKSTLGILFLTIFLDLVGFSIIFPLFPAMLEYYLDLESGEPGFVSRLHSFLLSISGDNADPFRATVFFGGALGSLYAFIQFFASPLWGALSDKIGRRPVLLITVGGLFLSYLLWIFSARFELLLIARILGGLAAGNISVATAVVADVTTAENRSKGMALIGVAFGLGFIIGPAIGGLSSQWVLSEGSDAWFGLHPFSVPAIISAGLAAVNLLWIATKLPETLPTEGELNKEHASSPPIFQLFQIKTPGVASLILFYFFYLLAFSGMEFTLTFFAVDSFAYTPMQNGWMFVFIGVVLILCQGGLVRRLAPKLGDKKLGFSGMIIGIAGFALLAFSGGSQGIFFSALTLITIGISFVNPTLSALVSNASEAAEQGRALGIFRSAGSLARAVGPIVASILYFLGAPLWAYLFCALLGLIAAVGMKRIQIGAA
ncbi:MAG: MFS transporter [Opitutales bacterium]|nr:MFS transporter [Opitutales bacterium]